MKVNYSFLRTVNKIYADYRMYTACTDFIDENLGRQEGKTTPPPKVGQEYLCLPKFGLF